MTKNTQEHIRISASTLSNIRDPEGRHALLLNKGAQARGELILSPLGGAVEATPLGRATLKDMLDLQEEDFEKGNDIRLKNVPTGSLNAFVEWFVARTDRELTPLRELSEELIDEAKILGNGMLAGAEYQFSGYGYERAISARSGTETVRFGDVYSVTVPPAAMEVLTEKANEPTGALVFASEREIMQQETDSGIQIATISQFLINHSNELGV